jgi:hypothetical protein
VDRGCHRGKELPKSATPEIKVIAKMSLQYEEDRIALIRLTLEHKEHCGTR